MFVILITYYQCEFCLLTPFAIVALPKCVFKGWRLLIRVFICLKSFSCHCDCNYSMVFQGEPKRCKTKENTEYIVHSIYVKTAVNLISSLYYYELNQNYTLKRKNCMYLNGNAGYNANASSIINASANSVESDLRCTLLLYFDNVTQTIQYKISSSIVAKKR